MQRKGRLMRARTERLFAVVGMGVLASAVAACSASSDGSEDQKPAEESALGAAAAVSFQNGVSPTANYAGATDTNIEEATPTTADGADVSLHADFDFPNGTQKNIEGLLRFDLSAIPVGSTITSATLTVNVTNRTTGAGYALYPLARAWSATQATWNSTASASAWATAGARGASDRGASAVGILAPTATGSTTVTLNAAGLAAVTGWVANPAKNFGLVIDTASDPDGLVVDSSNATTPANRPKLSIAYTAPAAPAPGNGTGLRGDYYSGTALATLVTSRTDANVNFSWSGSPATDVPADLFSVRWSGQVLPLYSQTYTFFTSSDDGVRVWVNGAEVINDWTNHASTEDSGTIALTAGKKYDIKVEYYESTGSAVAKLSWASTSQAKEVIPAHQLFPTATVIPAPTGFVHPGIMESKSQLDFVKAKIAANEAPWTTFLAKAKSSRVGQLTYKAVPVVNMQCGNSGSTLDIGCSQAGNDAVAAYTQALIWYYTGDQRYADNAIAILNAWSELKTIAFDGTDNTTFQGPLEAAWLSESFPRSAEILRHSGSGWSSADAAKFGAMLNGAILPRIIKGWNGNANWNLSMANGTINIGVYNDDKVTYENGIAQWRSHVKQDFYNVSDGAFPLPLSNEANASGAWKSTATMVTQWYGQTEFDTARTNGITQETCRDLGHTQFSLASTVYAAETVRIQGTDDLYGEEQARIIASHEYVAHLENSHLHAGAGLSVAVEPWLCGGSITVSVLPTWEVAYNHYNGRKHVAMPETAETITFMRANVGGYTNLQLAWETLTHAFQ